MNGIFKFYEQTDGLEHYIVLQSPIESVKPEAEAKLTGPEDEPKTKDSENAQDEETPEKDSSAEAAELTDAVKGEPSSSKIEEKNDAGAEVSAAGGSKKITDIKVNTTELPKKSPSAVNVTASGSPPIVVKEYFVKYKGLSYLHCEWATEEVLTYKDKRFPLKLKRFKQVKRANCVASFYANELTSIVLDSEGTFFPNQIANKNAHKNSHRKKIIVLAVW